MVADIEYNVVEFVQEDPSEKCQEKTKIVYLKTHKCASSSLQNIFLRFGEKRNLSFVLPKGRLKNSYLFNEFIKIFP